MKHETKPNPVVLCTCGHPVTRHYMHGWHACMDCGCSEWRNQADLLHPVVEPEQPTCTACRIDDKRTALHTCDIGSEPEQPTPLAHPIVDGCTHNGPCTDRCEPEQPTMPEGWPCGKCEGADLPLHSPRCSLRGTAVEPDTTTKPCPDCPGDGTGMCCKTTDLPMCPAQWPGIGSPCVPDGKGVCSNCDRKVSDTLADQTTNPVQGTHHASCWRSHPMCAQALLERIHRRLALYPSMKDPEVMLAAEDIAGLLFVEQGAHRA